MRNKATWRYPVEVEARVVLMWDTKERTHYVLCETWDEKLENQIKEALAEGGLQVSNIQPAYRFTFFDMDILPDILNNEDYMNHNQHRIKGGGVGKTGRNGTTESHSCNFHLLPDPSLLP